MSNTYEERRATEAAEMVAYHEKMDRVAKLLDAGPWEWSGNEHGTPWGTFTGPEGARIHAGYWSQYAEQRLHFTGELPSKGYAETDPEIGCALTKTAEQLARDVNRRLLPGYLERLPEKLEQAKRTEEYNAAKAANAARLKELFGHRGVNYLNREGGRIELDVTMAEAELIAKALREYREIDFRLEYLRENAGVPEYPEGEAQ